MCFVVDACASCMLFLVELKAPCLADAHVVLQDSQSLLTSSLPRSLPRGATSLLLWSHASIFCQIQGFSQLQKYICDPPVGC